ncbi:endonuclease [Paenibacillus sp. LMG 31456]|uniref:Endonuclease n=1 Tax=Paenibacillus foliorum TaxID=2654974 RepID=A0A972GYG4_9BACL|nr:endonuclease/exonuclease/phosphatase family protein [Paenibacillus foliorum]NOU96498.1 endonuclease [Paenibacillus foliorum]
MIRRHPRLLQIILSILTIACVLQPMQQASMEDSDGQNDDSGKENHMRLMTYNLRFLNDKDEQTWKSRLPLIVEMIQQLRPDVFGTQEGVLKQHNDLSAALPEYDKIGGRSKKDNFDEVTTIYYNKTRVSPLENGQFWLSDTPNVEGSRTWGNRVRRLATWVKFQDMKTKQPFYFLNTHLDHESEEARHKGAQLIAYKVQQFEQGVPVFVTADFNDDVGSETYKLFKNAGFLDSMITSKTRIGENLGTFNGFNKATGSGMAKRIDWILYQGDVSVEHLEINDFAKNGKYPSDHFPVIADVKQRKEISVRQDSNSSDDRADQVPPLLITEIVPKSSSGQQYGYIEMYNASEQDIDLSDYKIHYYSDPSKAGTSDEGTVNKWDITKDVFSETSVIKAKEVKVVWLKKEIRHDAPLDEFISNYSLEQSSLTGDQMLVLKTPGTEGMNGNLRRAVAVVGPQGDIISLAEYNDKGLNVTQNDSIIYTFPKNGSNKMVTLDVFQTPTPGTLQQGQVPSVTDGSNKDTE